MIHVSFCLKLFIFVLFQSQGRFSMRPKSLSFFSIKCNCKVNSTDVFNFKIASSLLFFFADRGFVSPLRVHNPSFLLSS